MLFLVGTGIAYNDIPMRAIEVCKRCTLYAEIYTSISDEAKMKYLSDLFGKEIKILSREDMEEGAKEIVAKAAKANIAILVAGDPLMATTHKILIIEAKKQGISTQILHASSAISAVIGESGLDFYKFGAICTIPKWHDNYKPVSFYEKIERNFSSNLHSLVLLENSPEKGSTLPVPDAIMELEAAESHYKKGIIGESTKIFIMQNIGLPSQKIVATTIKAARSHRSEGVATIIIPVKLSEIEEEAVKSLTVV